MRKNKILLAEPVIETKNTVSLIKKDLAKILTKLNTKK